MLQVERRKGCAVIQRGKPPSSRYFRGSRLIGGHAVSSTGTVDLTVWSTGYCIWRLNQSVVCVPAAVRTGTLVEIRLQWASAGVSLQIPDSPMFASLERANIMREIFLHTFCSASSASRRAATQDGKRIKTSIFSRRISYCIKHEAAYGSTVDPHERIVRQWPPACLSRDIFGVNLESSTLNFWYTLRYKGEASRECLFLPTFCFVRDVCVWRREQSTLL